MKTRHCISGCGGVVPSGLGTDGHKTNASLGAEHLGEDGIVMLKDASLSMEL